MIPKFQKALATLLLMLLCGLAAQAQTVTVIQPNGGEVLYACQTYTITWSQTGSPSNYWNIDYSLDGGTIWASVSSNYLATNGQFVWTVPNVQSNTVKIRVTDAGNGATTDQSNAVFTINIPVNLTSPNGGEVWQGNSVHNITWTATGTTNFYNIAYSTNGGSTWTNIVTNSFIPGGSYAWTVPNTPSTNCLVRVQDFTTNCMQDISASVFEISPATPILLTPNGGESWLPECAYNITWVINSFYSNVRLEYSTNNGSTWNLITSATSNTGSYNWTIPLSVSANCLVKASNTSNVNINDVSNAVFAIAPPYTVTSPNGGETWFGCSTYPITFNKPNNCVGQHRIEYSTDNGATWVAIVNPANVGATAGQTYNWTVPNGITSAQCLIRTSNFSNALETDVSNTVFNIAPSNDITVTSPNGGETWQGLSTQTISWTNLPSASGLFTIQYSTDNGASWTTIASNLSGNNYTWSVPNIPSTTCLVKVLDFVNTCKFDVSNAVFTITPATPILLTPNGSESWLPECAYNITWNAATFYSNVRLEYSTNNGGTWNLITSATSNTGSYNWTIPLSVSASCLVKASNTSNLSVNDVSNAVFAIAAPYTVTSPNGGETWYGCSTYPITFNKPNNCVGQHRIEYSTDNGATWVAIVNPANLGATAGQTYNWTVPNGITSAQCLIRTSNFSNALETDVSNAVFNIAPSNDITVTSPNGGEIWQGLSTQTISWTNLPSASGFYTLQYSTDNGASWTGIASNITGNSYAWSVPNIPSTTCLIKVIDFANTCKFDVSNAVFTISPATPILLTPNGGESWLPECAYNITWNAATFYSNVRLEYSTNNGGTWNLITSATSNTGSYNWTIPLSVSANCLVKASNTSNVNINDVSNAVFAIAPPYTVTSPNGGETWYGCSTYPITFNKPNNCVGQHRIEYSTDNGATWVAIVNPANLGATAGQTYNWIVPNGITSAQCLIRTSNFSNALETDVSNTVFNIAPSNDITVTSPNGGQIWQGLSTQTISWTNLPSASGFYTVQYSTDNGASWTGIASNITGNSYAWSVPNIPSTTCLIKVIDFVNTCKFDVSNAVFTITPATPILLTPNGGESWLPECAYNITWNAATFYSNVRLEYSTNNGSTWNLITSATSNTGSYNWTIPLTVSANCLVKASNTSNVNINDVSNAVFAIAPPYTVTSPNGGETWFGCSTYPITFNKPNNCVGQHRIEYSTDNGATWVAIVNPANVGATAAQTYNWTVPNGITSAQCLIRTSNFSNALETDVSNAVFNIAPSNDITVTSPNGGETWQGLSTQTISWTNLPSASGLFTIQYSTDNGASWNTIASNLSGNNYTWSVPNLPSTTCLVKVLDFVNTCKFDVSNAVFTITPATPILLTPNGGESWMPECAYNITWNAATFYSNVRLEYSTNNGSTWNLITSATSNTGSYNWTIPLSVSASCLVKASNASNLSVNDVSNAVFAIAAPYTVTSPNGGETWFGCSTYPITFNKPNNCVGQHRIEYSTDNGTTWVAIVNPANLGATAGQTYNWTVPNGITSAQCLIRTSNFSNGSETDVSNAVFNIAPSNDITVTSPNGGEIWQGLSNHNITWTNLPAASGNYTLQYSTDNGGTWTTIASNVSGNSYAWAVPNQPSTTCLIKVIDFVNSCKFDVSNAVFTITPATPILTAPNGGQVWYSGTNQNITWTAATFYSNVRLEYSADNGTSWVLITSATSNSGSYNWTVPNASSIQCLVKASNTANVAINDVSDAVFTIKPAVTVITPNGDNGNTIWGGCTVTSITFDRSPAWTSYTIQYSSNNGTTWNTITTTFSTTANPATFNWNIPNLTTSQALVKVIPNLATAYPDQSDNTFTVTKPVTIIQPNFGGILQVGSSYPVKWQSDGISSLYDIFYSTNGGTTWTNIVLGYNTSNNTYGWTVPNTPSTNCLMRVRDNVNNCKEDTSNVPFTISTTAPPITLLTPNGNDTIASCAAYNITWSETSPIGTYDIAYSTNGGSTWTNIVTNYPTGVLSYPWSVPNLNSSTVLVRVRSSSNNTIFDLSNAYFGIAPTEVVATPATLTLCAGASAQLNATGVPSYSWTPTTNLSCTNCANPIASPTANTNYIVQYSNGFCTVKDTIAVTIIPLPATPTAGSNSPVTPGNTINLTASTVPGATYFWTGPNGFTSTQQNPSLTNATLAMAGNYTVTATVNGCTSVAGITNVVVGIGSAVVSGTIRHPNGSSVIRTTTVDFSGTSTGSMVTGTNGQYSLSLNAGGNYTVAPAKANDSVTNNGVTTLDLVLMQRHILNIDTLNSPYKILAGDVNNSSSVTTLDIVLTRMVILQSSLTFPGGRLWTMVDASHTFPLAYSPWPFPSTRNYPVVAAASNQDYYGVKLGDVNWSWNPVQAKVDAVGDLVVNVGDATGKAGDVVTVPVTVAQFTEIAGYQFSVDWDPSLLEYVGYAHGSTAAHVGETQTADGHLLISWNDEAGGFQTLPDGSLAFNLRFRVLQNTQPNTMITIGKDIVHAEAYNDQLDMLDIVSRAGRVSLAGAAASGAASDAILLQQNFPNPFDGQTTIRFELPESRLLHFVISDLQGKQQRTFEGVWDAGTHELVWDGRNASGTPLASGTYILTVQAGSQTRSIRMVLMRD